jgi:hypothetical protein
MKHKLMRLLALVGVGTLLAAGSVAVVGPAASADSGVIDLQSKDDAPRSTVWTLGVPNPETCMVTDTGVHTQPGAEHEAEYEIRSAYSQVIPGQVKQSHTEYKYERTVADYKTQYHFAKFTREKTKSADVRGFWQKFSPNRGQGPLTSAPAYPTDPRGTWSEKKYNGGPDQDKSGVYSSSDGNGRSSWFYRQQTVTGTWGDFGPWTKWLPEQHTSWQDSDEPLGTPQLHAQGANFYREWQARFDGQTRQVETGTHVETSEWLTAPPAGDGWVQIDSQEVVTQEATDDKTVYFFAGGEPTETLTEANYTTDNPGEGWTKVKDKEFETRAAYTDPDVVTLYSHTYRDPECGTFTPTCTTVTDAQTIVGDGVISVPGGWASNTIGVPFSGTLADIGTVLDIDADPIQYVGLHIHTAQGTLVFEEEPTYGGNLWSTATWDGVNPGLGYAAFGSIQDFIHLNGAVEVTGIDLLYTHPEASSTTVTSFTVGCTVFTFEAEQEPPVEEPEEPTDPVEPPVEEPVDETPTPAPVVTPAASADELAVTGNDAGVWLVAGILGVLLVGAGTTLAIRRRNSRV